MPKVNLAKQLVGLDGKKIKDTMMSHMVANVLASVKSKDPVGDFILAQKIYTSTEAVEMTEAQIKAIEDALTSAQLTALVEAQIKMELTKGK